MISRSPERNTFQRDCHIKEAEENGNEPNAEYLEMFKSIEEHKREKEADPEWQKENLEYDLRSTDWILQKVRTSESYAQNLYAAMCNNGFIKLDVMPILKNQEWGCSWRYAGGIVADMRQEGDYIDYYCSGIGANAPDVGEGCITEEIREDLQRLGWAVAPGGDWENFE